MQLFKSCTKGVMLCTAIVGLAATQAFAQTEFDPATEPGMTAPDSVVEARQALKFQVSELLIAIEAPLEAGTVLELSDAQLKTSAISAMLLAFQHLFPPQTHPDALVESDPDVWTDAAPAVWEQFATFQAMVAMVSDTAAEASGTESLDEFAAMITTLRDQCSACHEVYLDFQMDFMDFL